LNFEKCPNHLKTSFPPPVFWGEEISGGGGRLKTLIFFFCSEGGRGIEN